jgi:hypothetical protein
MKGAVIVEIESLNELLTICELGNNEQITDQPYERFGLFEESISFIGNNAIIFNNTIEKLHISRKEVYDTLSEKTFKKIIVNDLTEHKISKKKYTKDDINLLISKIKQIPISTYKILRDIQGVFFESNIEQCRKEFFTIYYWPKGKTIIEQTLGVAPETLWLANKHEYLIETEVSARDNEKAIELADQKFELFTYFLHVHMGSLDKKHYISIIQQRFFNYEHIYCFKGKEISNTVSLMDYVKPIPIDNEFFAKRNDFNNMWKLIANHNTQLEKRLTLAISWLGQAYRETSIQNGFLKAAISLEIIFTYSESTIINPSILNQISESIALILGKNAEQRLNIEKEMKELYSVRSAIAHAGKDNVANEKFHLICNYARAVILELTNNDGYKVSKIGELYEVLKRQKYSN